MHDAIRKSNIVGVIFIHSSTILYRKMHCTDDNYHTTCLVVVLFSKTHERRFVIEKRQSFDHLPSEQIGNIYIIDIFRCQMMPLHSRRCSSTVNKNWRESASIAAKKDARAIVITS